MKDERCLTGAVTPASRPATSTSRGFTVWLVALQQSLSRWAAARVGDRRDDWTSLFRLRHGLLDRRGEGHVVRVRRVSGQEQLESSLREVDPLVLCARKVPRVPRLPDSSLDSVTLSNDELFIPGRPMTGYSYGYRSARCNATSCSRGRSFDSSFVQPDANENADTFNTRPFVVDPTTFYWATSQINRDPVGDSIVASPR